MTLIGGRSSGPAAEFALTSSQLQIRPKAAVSKKWFRRIGLLVYAQLHDQRRFQQTRGSCVTLPERCSSTANESSRGVDCHLFI